MRLLIVDDIAGRLDLLQAVLARGRAEQVQAVCILGNLLAPPAVEPSQSEHSPTFEDIMQLLRPAALPSYLIPGRRDIPLAALQAAASAPGSGGPVILVHSMAVDLGRRAVIAGFGGLLRDEEGADPSMLEVMSTRAMERFRQMAAYNPIFQFAEQRIFLFGTPTATASPTGAPVINALIAQYRPSLVCTGNGTEGPALEMLHGALVVTPGSLAAGSYAIVDLERRSVNFARLGKTAVNDCSAPPHEILVPLDDTPLSAQILPAVSGLALAMGRGVHLLHVLPAGGEESERADTMEPIHLPYLETAAHFFLAAAAEPLRNAGLRVTTEVARGDVVPTILTTARRRAQIQLIAMATTAGRLHGHWPLGSVAQKVLHEAAVPLLLQHAQVRPPERAEQRSVRTVLVCLDGSEEASAALPEAHTIATTTGATLILLAVTPSAQELAAAAEGVPYRLIEESVREQEQKLMAELEGEAEQLRHAGLSVQTRVKHGVAEQQIVQTADEVDADLIVMATHGRSGWRQLLLGSVALSTLLTAHQPVLLVRSTAGRQVRTRRQGAGTKKKAGR